MVEPGKQNIRYNRAGERKREKVNYLPLKIYASMRYTCRKKNKLELADLDRMYHEPELFDLVHVWQCAQMITREAHSHVNCIKLDPSWFYPGI